MKHLKRFNEHYDTEDLKGKFEIPELKGEIDFHNLVHSDNIVTDKNPNKYGKTFAQLAIDIPFLENFKASKANDMLTLFKKYEKEFSESEKMEALLLINIDVNDDDSYVLQMSSEVIGYVNGDKTVLFEDDYTHQLMNSIDELRGVFRSTILYKIKEWSNAVKRYIGEEFMPVDVEQARFSHRSLRYN